jgi:hypothetical protein
VYQINHNDKLSKQGDFSELQSTHIMLCALKAIFTSWEADGYANLIKACGGHGYSSYSGLPHLLTEGFPNQIMEGENSMLLLQTTRLLVKGFAAIQRGKAHKVSGNLSFLKNMDEIMEQVFPATPETLTPEILAKMFTKATCHLTRELTMKMFNLVQQEGHDAKLVWDTMVGVENLQLAKIYSIHLILNLGLETIKRINNEQVRDVIRKAFNYQALTLAEEYGWALLQAGIATREHLEMFVNKKLDLLSELSDHLLVLAEGLQWPDSFLGSAIGSSDKEPYETLYTWAKSIGTLNRYENQVHPAVLEYQMKVAKHREQRL